MKTTLQQSNITVEAALAAAQAAVRKAESMGVRINGMKVTGEDEGMKLGFAARPRMVVFGGGLPIRIDGELVGGIGVSGASAEQDEACARAGLEAIGADQI